MMLSFRKKSDWGYDTSSSLDLGISLGAAIAIGVGNLFLVSPSKDPRTYWYTYAGAGGGLGFKFMPRFSGTISKNEYPSRGAIFILDSFVGDELQPRDLEGFTLIVQLSGGVYISGSISLLLLGLDQKDLQDEAYSDIFQLLEAAAGVGPLGLDALDRLGLFTSKAKAGMIMGGGGKGVTAGASLIGSLGYLSLQPVRK